MSDESFRYAVGELHDCVVPAKAPKKDPRGSAERLEGRRSIKENTGEPLAGRLCASGARALLQYER